MYPMIDTEAEQRDIELRIAEMTRKGGEYYPYTRDHIVEAISEMPDFDFDDFDVFQVMKVWCTQYWLKAARAVAKQSVLQSRP